MEMSGFQRYGLASIDALDEMECAQRAYFSSAYRSLNSRTASESSKGVVLRVQPRPCRFGSGACHPETTTLPEFQLAFWDPAIWTKRW